MKNNALVAVGAVFLVLLAAWFFTRDSQPKVGVKELKTAKLVADDVTKVEITIPAKPAPKPEGGEGPLADPKPAEPAKPATTVVLERDGSGFVVSSSASKDSTKKFPVDDGQLKPLLDAIAEFSAGDVVANKAEKHKEFEIDDSQATRVVITTKAGKALDLLFGRAAKGGGTTVREQGKNEVFVAKGRLGAVAKKELGQWRKKALLDKKAEDITSVTVARADGEKLVLTGKAEEPPPPPEAKDGEAPPPPPAPKTTWTVTEPATLPAGFRVDEGALGRVAASLATLRAADFADDVDDNAAGFAAPHTTVAAKLKDGKDVVLHLGGKDDKKRVYAKLEGEAQVYLLAEYAAKNVDKALQDLRDLTLLPVALDDVTQATFTASKTKFVVKKDAGAWSLVEPKAAPPEFDAGQIASVVGGVLRLKGTRLAEGVADAGGGDVAVEVVAAGKTYAIRFGKGVPEEGKDGKAAEGPPKEIYVKGGDGQVYVMSSFTKGRYEKLNDLFKKPPSPPPGMPGMGGPGGMNGLDSLPPDVRKKLEASLKQQGIK